MLMLKVKEKLFFIKLTKANFRVKFKAHGSSFQLSRFWGKSWRRKKQLWCLKTMTLHFFEPKVCSGSLNRLDKERLESWRSVEDETSRSVSTFDFFRTRKIFLDKTRARENGPKLFSELPMFLELKARFWIFFPKFDFYIWVNFGLAGFFFETSFFFGLSVFSLSHKIVEMILKFLFSVKTFKKLLTGPGRNMMVWVSFVNVRQAQETCMRQRQRFRETVALPILGNR